MNRALFIALFTTKGIGATIRTLLDQYGASAFAKLNDITPGGLPNFGTSGADDTLGGGFVIGAERQPDGTPYIDATSAGHVDIGITDIPAQPFSLLFTDNPSSDSLSTTASAWFRLYIDANNYILAQYTTTANQAEINYSGGGASNLITAITGFAADTENHIVITVEGASGFVKFYWQGLLSRLVAITNAISGTDIDNANSVIGALDTSNTSPHQGQLGELQIKTTPFSDFEIRRDALTYYQHAPFGTHDVYAIQLDGTADYLDLGTAISDDLEAGCTVSLWVRIDTYAVNDRIISLGDGFYLAMTAESSGDVKLTLHRDFDSTDGTWVMDNFDLTVGTFHHVVVVYDDSVVDNDPVLYVDGTAVDLTESSTPVGSAVDLASEDLDIGANGGSNASAMTLRDASVWSVELDSAEVAELATNRDLTTHSQVANILTWLRCGDYLANDSDNTFDYLDNFGDGLIVDATQAPTYTTVYEDNFDEQSNGTDVTTLANWSAYGSPTNRDIQDGTLRLTTTAGNQGALLSVSTTAGTIYELKFTSSGDVDDLYMESPGRDVESHTGQRRVFVRPSGSSFDMYFRANSNNSGETFYSNISFRSISGVNALPVSMDNGAFLYIG